MSKTRVRINSVPEGLQGLVAEAAADLVDRFGVDPTLLSITKLERLERSSPEDETPAYEDFGERARPDYRIFFMVKGTQYVYETRRGKSPKLIEKRFVL